MPQVLLDLVGKTFQFVLSIKKDNHRGSNDTYKVSYVFVGLDTNQELILEIGNCDDDLAIIVTGDQEIVAHSKYKYNC